MILNSTPFFLHSSSLLLLLLLILIWNKSLLPSVQRISNKAGRLSRITASPMIAWLLPPMIESHLELFNCLHFLHLPTSAHIRWLSITKFFGVCHKSQLAVKHLTIYLNVSDTAWRTKILEFCSKSMKFTNLFIKITLSGLGFTRDIYCDTQTQSLRSLQIWCERIRQWQ